MDFASLMGAEISKSKGPVESRESTKKYLKRAELEAQRQENYLKEQAALQRDREEKTKQKRKREEEVESLTRERDEKRKRLAEESKARRLEQEAKEERARRKRLGLPDLPTEEAQDEADAAKLEPGEEVIVEDDLRQRLRDLKEPVLLFGESHAARLKRYRNLTAPSLITNSKDPIPTTLQPVPGGEMHVPDSVPKNADQASLLYIYRQFASYFNMLLTEWVLFLSQRDLATKTSSQGQQAEATMHSSVSALRPLFTKFEQASLPDAKLQPLLQIVSAMQDRRYVDANDGYLKLSIGKAAWPIGVTMVGIHERSAREKLNEGERGGAHVMGDEVTRRWLQAVKRCLSFAQVRWPPFDGGQLMG